MATITETLLTLAQDFRDAVAAVRGIETRLNGKFGENTNNITTIINQFNARPLYIDMWVDAINGNDANDGLTIEKPKRTIDAILGGLSTQGTRIYLLSDLVWSKRYITVSNLQIQGVQPANNVYKQAPARRKITFLGTAANSPSDTLGTMSAGLIADAGQLFTTEIDFMLPDVPDAVALKPHICSSASTNIIMINPTINVLATKAAALFGSFNSGRIIATLTPTFGAGATGKLFFGVAAGANPNTMWSYSTNVTSA